MSRPGVGVGVCVLNPSSHQGCVLLGRRRGRVGTGCFALPGGHLERFESWEDCAAREVLEETGLNVKNLRVGTVLNAVDRDNDYHYVVPIVVCETDGEPTNVEPDKCDGWDWYEWDRELPEPLFKTVSMLREVGFRPF